MNALPSIARSGLGAADAAMQAHAHNLANLGTEGFRRSGTTNSTAAGGGVQAQWTRAAAPGPAVEADLVGQLQAKNAALVNLAVFKAWDRMTGSLLRAVG